MAAPASNEIGHLAVTPAAVESANAYAVVSGSALDARNYETVSYTFKVITAAVSYKIFGANLPDFSDENEIAGPTSVAAAATGAWTPTAAFFGFYRVKVASTVADTPGTITVAGLAK